MPKIIVHVEDTTGREAVRPAFINGKKIEYPINTPFEASKELVAVLKDSTMTFEELPEGGSEPADPAGDEGAAVDHGGAGGATPTDDFDPEAIISGTVGEVAAALEGLTPEQLDAVEAAEKDREVPRKGVAEAIADARDAAKA